MKRRAPTRITLAKRQHEFRLQSQRERTVNILRLNVAYCLLGLFAVNTLSVLTMIFLVGLGRMALSEKLIIILIGETVAQAATNFLSITKFVFPRGKISE